MKAPPYSIVVNENDLCMGDIQQRAAEKLALFERWARERSDCQYDPAIEVRSKQ